MTRKPKKRRYLELKELEARLAPATLLNLTTLSYTDGDGDAVTVRVSRGTLTLSTPNGGPGIASKIASIIIGGQVLGTVGGTDHFGFVAQQVGLFRVNGITFPPHAGPGNDLTRLPVGPTADVVVHEVV
jgi:hypothetical protein